MNIKNFEFKAKIDEIAKYENLLLTLNPKFQGLDHQIDTYFNANQGRLKLREGTIENSLIHYDRENVLGSKESQIILYQHEPNVALKNILTKQLGVKTVVDKKRKIYFIDHVKFHFDLVEGLGTFLEVEAIDSKEEFTLEELKLACDNYFHFFELTQDQVIDRSYSDLIMELN
ncbi:class IV adenylate cyclase [Fluviicola taffensis]|uniref:class IV adenylate cyclase n=1 Tax=Fluviicola taffensis TaxID=191579 RepID=UPI0031376E8D